MFLNRLRELLYTQADEQSNLGRASLPIPHRGHQLEVFDYLFYKPATNNFENIKQVNSYNFSINIDLRLIEGPVSVRSHIYFYAIEAGTL